MEKKNEKWTYERCKEEASKYGTITDFKRGSQYAYVVSKKNGWLGDFLKSQRKPKGYWQNKEMLIELAASCKNSADFYEKYSTGYMTAVRNGWTKELIYNKI